VAEGDKAVGVGGGAVVHEQNQTTQASSMTSTRRILLQRCSRRPLRARWVNGTRALLASTIPAPAVAILAASSAFSMAPVPAVVSFPLFYWQSPKMAKRAVAPLLWAEGRCQRIGCAKTDK